MSLSDNRLILLAGMHRSGTSALARVWNILGAVLPEPLVPPGVGNELGHWEPADVVAMNDRALLAAGSDVNSVLPVPAPWFFSHQGRAFQREVTDYVRPRLEASPLVVIKDPRVSPLARAWRAGVEKLGAEPRFIIALRDPWEVAQSLSSRQLKHFPDEVWPKERVTAIWLHYVLTVEQASRGLPRSFVDYAWLLDDWRGEVERMAAQLGVELEPITDEKAAQVDAFLQREARHATRDDAAPDDDVVARAYALLKERRDDPAGGAKALDALRKQIDVSANVLGGYVCSLEVRSREIAAARAEAREASGALEAQRELAEAAERRVLHLSRMRETAAPGASPPISAGDADALRTRLAALTAAHRELAEDIKRERQGWADERAALMEQRLDDLAALRDAHDQALSDLYAANDQALSDLRDAHVVALAAAHVEALDAASAAHEEDSSAKAAEAAQALEAAVEEAKNDPAPLARLEEARTRLEEAQVQVAAERRAAKRLHRAIAVALGRDPADEAVTDTMLSGAVRALADAGEKQTVALDALRIDHSELQAELEGSRSAYEDVRLQVVALRKRLKEAEAENTALARSMQDEIAVFADAAESLREQRRETEIVLADHQRDWNAQLGDLQQTKHSLATIYASRTWRIATAFRRLGSPVRPLLALVRRSLRPQPSADPT